MNPDAGTFPPVGRRWPVVPPDGRAGRSLVALIAILAFLASLAAGAAAIVAASSAGWREDLAREATIQVKPVAGRNLDDQVAAAAALARTVPGVREATPLPRAEAERLLEPWLGAGLDLSDLPVPRLVRLQLDPLGRPALRMLADRLRAEIPGASLDDHAAWRSRLVLAANTAIGLALASVLLVLAASAGAIAFATRGAMAGHRDVVEVLHFVGADDRFVARTFARRFARQGLVGGAIGAGAAALLLTAAASVFGSALGEGGDGEAGMLLGSLVLGPWPYAGAVAVALADGAVAGLVSAAYVKHFLKGVRRG